jgi:hypothetical protein
MPTVELIYDPDCPNVEGARTKLQRAFHQTGLLPQWQEWDRTSPHSPVYVRGYGSPTILVNGQDVASLHSANQGDCCRIYAEDGGRLAGVPPTKTIVSALRKARTGEKTRSPERGRLNSLAVFPATGAALIPGLTCPACWPAYAAILGSLGLGFVNYTPYLLPTTIGFLGLALASLGYRARDRRGYGPLLLGSLAASLVVVGKFLVASAVALYAGVALLVTASLWNLRPRRARSGEACPACGSSGEPD